MSTETSENAAATVDTDAAAPTVDTGAAVATATNIALAVASTTPEGAAAGFALTHYNWVIVAAILSVMTFLIILTIILRMVGWKSAAMWPEIGIGLAGGGLLFYGGYKFFSGK
jgi:hypothetical protein